jgi:hypothetical protein
MKGTIGVCLQELIQSAAGRDGWAATLTAAGMDPSTKFTAIGTVPDADVMKLINAAAGVLKVPVQGAIDAFGEYWASVYAPKMYGVYYGKHKSAKAFLLSMDDVHTTMTVTTGAKPPHFTFSDTGPQELVMRYDSPRGLEAMLPSLIKGVAKHYRERVTVRPVGKEMRIAFG